MNRSLHFPVLALAAVGLGLGACGVRVPGTTQGSGGGAVRAGGTSGGLATGGGASGGGAAGGGAAATGGGTGGVTVKPIIYQLVVRHFGNTSTGRVKDGTIAENGVGKFNDVNDAALASLRALGVTHVWYTGVFRQATLTDYTADGMPADDPDIVKGRAGSFFAIRDYYDVSPDYASTPNQRLAEFDAMVARTKAAGLKVLIDFVPNHVARSYQSVVKPETDFGVSDVKTQFFSPRNDFFYVQGTRPLSLTKPGSWQITGLPFDKAFARENGTADRPVKVTGNDQATVTPSENDWYETVKLNYGVNFQSPGAPAAGPVPTWQKVDAIIKYWQDRGVDGFRCDLAQLVPDAAWQYLIGEARKRDPAVYFMAEAYSNLPGLLTAGFDSVYNDELYDTLRNKYRGASINELDGKLTKLSSQDRPRYVQYLENHDECRIPVAAGCDGGPSFFSANAGRQLGPLTYLASNGPVLFYNGQEFGETGQGAEGFGGEDGRTTLFDYWSLPALQTWVNDHQYNDVNLTSEQKALRDYYGSLLTFAQNPLVRAEGFQSLMTANPALASIDLHAFARYQTGGGRLLVVVTNFRPGAAGNQGTIKLPADLLDAAGIPAGASKALKLVFDRNGKVETAASTVTREQLVGTGFQVTVPDQTSFAYLIE
jgi:glycosidase